MSDARGLVLTGEERQLLRDALRCFISNRAEWVRGERGKTKLEDVRQNLSDHDAAQELLARIPTDAGESKL